ncbi:long-chain fatty acid--CoA ligase [Phocaeicola sp.]|uniref:AMP-dependent synthetase/ligase n=1 Tax=Phocaeicola sp. TaxID=2773926 RepID=UPI0023C5D858|nr:long-chain fatty acid--CoA ligase [Phocaeicola sp.]MDE5677675.1 long-chain fatty acid--CoA ligase [Phocaeicola sp.]
MSSSFLSVLIQHQAGKYGDRVALRYRDYTTETWIPVSWNQFAATVKTVSNALVELGVGVQENIAVFSQNKPECLYVDFGAFGVRAVTVPFYATSSEAQVHYMIGDAEIRYIFVGEQLQYDVAFRVMQLGSHLKQIIIFDKEVKRDERDQTSIYFDDFLKLGEAYRCQAEVDRRTSESGNGDLANILYTSGTTGESKGVMLHHACYEGAIPAHNERFPKLGEKDLVMNFLPFTHVFERAWSYWCLSVGCTLAINLRPVDIQKTIREIRPTAMCSVPRFWEKVYAGVQEKINETTGLKKKLMLDAIRVGREHNVEYVCKGMTPPPFLHMKYKFYEKTIYSLLKKTIGIENGRFFPTAGAAIPPAVQEFVLSVGINMVAGYGLTESTATVSCENDYDHVVGSVGRIMPHVQVRIGENNEIQLRGEGITHGYYKKEAATAAAFTEDGWFHTGDAGYIKDDHLFLTERIKDLFKTSNGKYIAPQAIEAKLIVDRYIDQISIIADERKFVSALIIPEYKLVEEYAQRKGICYGSMEELLQKREIVDLFKERIDTLQQQFAHYEQIKKFTLLPRPFSMERGELTNTLKIKRNVLNKNYAAEIEKMYEE